MRIFAEFNIEIRPPLKLLNTANCHDEGLYLNDFLERRIKNFRKLLSHDDFRGQFTLKLNLKVDKFDLERDQLNTSMYLPTTQILYGEQHCFTELYFSFST